MSSKPAPDNGGTSGIETKWRSYTEAWTETAFLWPLKTILPYWLAVRQAVVRSPPFTARCRCLPRFTYFELFFMVALVVASIAGCFILVQSCAVRENRSHSLPAWPSRRTASSRRAAWPRSSR